MFYKTLVTMGLLLGFNHGVIAQNTAYGTDALKSVTTGFSNAAFGYQALYFNTTGFVNTASGFKALYSNTGGEGNTAGGANALAYNTTGNHNTATGFAALGYNISGIRNTASGYLTLESNKTGDYNTALGYRANVAKENLSNATAIGANAIVTDENTIQLGDKAVTKIYAGTGNTATLIAGGLKITGGTPATGKVLTSDASGVGTWQTPIIAPPSWSLTGNAGTIDGTSFIGTTDNIPFSIRVNNQKAGRIDPVLNNTFYGYQSGNFNTIGRYNAASGYQALFSNTTGEYNTANGTQALYSNTTGWFNTANGSSALVSNTTGDYNTANGTQTLYSNTTGAYNTANGFRALHSNTAGIANTANGSYALYSNTTGSDNTANGPYALYFNTTGNTNTANGSYALYSNTTGYDNTANGYQSLFSNTTGSNNTALGNRADVSSDNLNNATAIGSYAKVTASNTIQLGNNDVTKVFAGVGKNATIIAGGLQITGGTPSAGKVLTSDASGTATWQVPASTGWSLTGTASTVDGTNFIGTTDNIPFNIRVNNQKAGKIDHLKSNTFYGYQSGNVTTGFYNTANGTEALYTNTNGKYNNANGFRALYNNTTGENNTATGSQSLYVNTTGSNNTAIGFNADVSVGNLDNATAIGYDAKVNASNKVVIGNRDVTVIGGYTNWTNLSDARFKKNIQKDVHGLDFIMQLKPVSYNLDVQKLNSFLGVEERNKNAKQTQAIAAKETIRYNGFLAQEVEQAAAAVQYNFSGVVKPANAKDHYSMSYSDFVVPLVKAVQEQQAQIEQLQKEKEQQEKKIEAQQKINDQLQRRIEALEKLMAGNSNTMMTKDDLVKPTTGNEIQVYPNPNGGMFNVVVPAGSQKIELIDMKGTLIKTINLDSKTSSHQLNLSGYAKGTYILNLWISGKTQTSKVIVQ